MLIYRDNILLWWSTSLIVSNISLVNAFDYFTEKPSYVKSCKIYEPAFTKCSTESIQKLMDKVVKGIPELQQRIGLVDPIYLEKLVFKQDNNEAATLRANLTNIKVSGFSQIKIKESKVSKADFSWETKIFLPKLNIKGQYQMAGKILLIPLTGAGDFFIDIENLDMIMRTKTHLYEKGSFTFYNVTQVRVQMEMTGVKTNFENIFNGSSKEVERQTNELFNKNWRDFFEALRPLITETVEHVLLNIMGTLFHTLPANFFVEDIPKSQDLYSEQM